MTRDESVPHRSMHRLFLAEGAGPGSLFRLCGPISAGWCAGADRLPGQVGIRFLNRITGDTSPVMLDGYMVMMQPPVLTRHQQLGDRACDQ
ncbi:MAG: hypothetical protein GEV04_19060 [Actinophytocola sp.]|nr:hypothetical protein [Actinophytocola sp.]